MVAALLGPVAPGKMCPYPGRLALHRVQSGALTSAAVGDTLHRTAKQALIYDADKKRASKPDSREKAVLWLQSESGATDSCFTVHASPSCGAQSQPLRDWVVNLHGTRREIYVTKVDYRGPNSNELVELHFGSRPARMCVPAGCKVRVASVQVVCKRSTAESRLYAAHLILETTPLEDRKSTDAEPRWGNGAFHSAGCACTVSMRLDHTSSEALQPARAVPDAGAYSRLQSAMASCRNSSTVPRNWRAQCATVISDWRPLDSSVGPLLTPTAECPQELCGLKSAILDRLKVLAECRRRGGKTVSADRVRSTVAREIRPVGGCGVGATKPNAGDGWVPLPAGWYKGLREGAAFVQVRYAQPWEAKSRPVFELEWGKRVGRRIAGVDPGVRCLYTLYDPSRSAYIRVGYGWTSYMDKCVHRRIRQLQSRIAEISKQLAATDAGADSRCERTKQKEQYDAELLVERAAAAKRSHAMEDVAFLVLSAYDVLILPKFGGKGMGERGNSISSHVTRRMRYHSFFKVRERLQQHAKITGRVLDLGSEQYSTAACPGCGTHNPTVGAAKFHQCRRRDGRPPCDAWDRDCGSARTILFLHIGKYLPEATADFAGSNSAFFEPLRLRYGYGVH